jgi:hypothetical protein
MIVQVSQWFLVPQHACKGSSYCADMPDMHTHLQPLLLTHPSQPCHPAHRCRVQRAESVAWLSLEEQLLEGLRQDPHVRWLLGRLLPMVRAGTMAPRSAADIALAYFYQHCG